MVAQLKRFIGIVKEQDIEIVKEKMGVLGNNYDKSFSRKLIGKRIYYVFDWAMKPRMLERVTSVLGNLIMWYNEGSLTDRVAHNKKSIKEQTKAKIAKRPIKPGNVIIRKGLSHLVKDIKDKKMKEIKNTREKEKNNTNISGKNKK